MSVGWKIKELIENMMKSAYIDSPRFDDYKIQDTEIDPGDVNDIDNALEAAIKGGPVKDQASGKPTAPGKTGLSLDELKVKLLLEKTPKKATLADIITDAFGAETATVIFAFFRNPLNFIIGLVTSPAGIAAIASAVVFAAGKMMMDELTRKGSIFDRTFKNVIDNRVEVLRTRELQQRLRVGFGEGSQLITTTNAGTTNPRYAFNSHNINNTDQMRANELFSIRNPSGYP